MEPGAASQELRVLLLEDTESDALLIEHELRRAGIAFVAKRVETRAAFVQALEEFRPDLILSDYKLPAFDGLSALKIVRDDYPEIPVIMVTGAIPDVEAVELIYAGAKDYVLKDRLARLAPAVQRVLSGEKGVRARKAAENALRESEAKFRALVESTSDWIWEVNEHGVYTYSSPQVYGLLGYSDAEVVGKSPLDLMAPEEAARLRESLGGILAGKKPFHLLEHANRHRDGREVWLESSGTPIFDGGGAFRGYRGIGRDITARKQLENQLRQAVAYNRSLIEAALDPLVTISPEGKITDVNAATEKATGKSRGELIGTDFSDYFTEPEKARAGYQQVFQQGYVTDYPLSILQDGRVMEVLYNANVYRDEGGRVLGVFAAARDITERKQNEAVNAARVHLVQFALTHSLDELLEETLNQAERLTGSQIGFYHFVEVDQNSLTLQSWSTRTKAEFCKAQAHGMHYPIAQAGVWADCLRRGKAVIHNDYASLPNRKGLPEGHATVIRELVVPVFRGDKVSAILGVGNKPTDYAESDVEAVSLIADLTAEIAARKRAEERIVESEKRFRALTDTSPLAIYMSSGIEQKAEYINPTFTRLFGYTLDEVPTVAHWWPLAYPDEGYRQEIVEEWQRKVEQAIATNSAIEPMEVVVTCKDGSKKDISWGYISTGVQNWAFGQDLTERKQAELALRRLNRALKALGAADHALVHSRDETELMQGICQAITEHETYRVAWVGRPRDDENKTVEVVAAAGAGRGYVDGMRVTWDSRPQGGGPTGTAIRTGQPQICQDFTQDPRMAPWSEAAAQYGLASSIALPLFESGVVTGVLSLYAAEPYAFDDEEVALLEEMAEDLAFGLSAIRTRGERDLALQEREQYANRLREGMESALQAISTTVEMRDPYTAGHQRRVADLAAAIARELGLPEERVHGIRLASIVHDLGKVHIPAEVLSKPARLSKLEFSFIKIHPQAGHDILKPIEFPWPIAQTVLQHHERLDGSGYPQGLQGDAIILEARILAVADVVESIASHRPYRPSLGLEAAFAEISDKRDVLFDPAVVDACLKLFREGYVLPG